MSNALASRLDEGIVLILRKNTTRIDYLVVIGLKSRHIWKASDIVNSLSKISHGKGGGKNDKARGSSAQIDTEVAMIKHIETLLEK